MFQEFSDGMSEVFEITVQKDPPEYLGWQITRDAGERYLKLSQEGYITQLAKNYGVDKLPPQ